MELEKTELKHVFFNLFYNSIEIKNTVGFQFPVYNQTDKAKWNIGLYLIEMSFEIIFWVQE